SSTNTNNVAAKSDTLANDIATPSVPTENYTTSYQNTTLTPIYTCTLLVYLPTKFLAKFPITTATTLSAWLGTFKTATIITLTSVPLK
ncbi:MAG: hypothetical protein UHZ06_02255, partial [Paludibacteraceae bacterium]|nr:hypothetical protein [Paludibacteraceae bacterium]